MPSSQTSTTYQDSSSGSESDQPNGQKSPKKTNDSIRKYPLLTRDKLSPGFQSSNNEDELGKLMGDAGEKFLGFVDDIFNTDLLRRIDLDIPQLVVVGDRSTGKSSVLQALTRLPFPVAAELCTRFVTKTTIHRCTPLEKPGYRIEAWVPYDEDSDPPFQPKVFDANEWIDVYQNLKEDMAVAFDSMNTDKFPSSTGFGMGGRSTNNSGSAVQEHPLPQLMEHGLHISVRKPGQGHFSIVDIPGLASNGAEADVELSEEFALDYIGDSEALVLVVIPADNVLENQKALTFVRENGASDRTIGVITRCDRIEETNEDKIFNLLRNQNDSQYHLKLGWFAVRNRSPKEILDESSFEERDKTEVELFENGKWKEAVSSPSYLNSLDPHVLGIKHLKHTIQQCLYNQLKKNLSNLPRKMGVYRMSYENNLKTMGDPRENERDQRAYLSNIQTRYESKVERSLKGNHRASLKENHASRIRHRINDFNEAFESGIEEKAIKYRWQPLDTDTPTTEGIFEKEPHQGIFKWIGQTVHTWEYQESESRFNPPQSLKRTLFKEQTYLWEEITRQYMEKVGNAVRRCNTVHLKSVCKNNDGLCNKIRERIKPLETKAFMDAEDELQRILGDLDYVGSWHPNLEVCINESQLSRRSKQVSKVNLFSSSLNGSSVDPVGQQALGKWVFEIHDWLYAYWRVAFPRYVDNIIIQVVERHLLGPEGPLRLFSRHWIDCLSKEELEELVGDSEGRIKRRKSLGQWIEELDNALEKVVALSNQGGLRG